MTDERTGSEIAPGWYSDPLRVEGLRWWSGEAWTEHVRAAPVPVSVPAPEPVPVIAPGVAPAQPGFHAVQPVYLPADPALPAIAPHQYRQLPPNNSVAWWSLALGALSLVLTVTVLVHSSATIIVSFSGVLAIINGVRAITLRRHGRATAKVAPILGIVFGSVGTFIMLLSFATAFLPQSTYTPTTGALPPAGTPPLGTLGRQPATPLPDNALNSYTRIAVASTSATAAGCQLTDAPLPFPSSTVARTPVRQEQDLMSWDIQPVSEALAAAKAATGGWPSIQVDPADGRVFTPDCKPMGFIPVGTTLEYAVSPDKADAALLIVDPGAKLGVLWRSRDNTLYLE